MITRPLLEQVTTFPHLMEEQAQLGRHRKRRGDNKVKMKNLLKDTPRILRDVFNSDGRLFAS